MRIDPPQFVYFAEARSGLVKIGVTTCVEKRIRSLGREAGPMRLLLAFRGNVVIERRMHQRFRSSRRRGEWFLLRGALRRFLLGIDRPGRRAKIVDRMNRFIVRADIRELLRERDACERRLLDVEKRHAELFTSLRDLDNMLEQRLASVSSERAA